MTEAAAQPLHYQTISQIVRQTKSGALSAETLTRHMLERIAERDQVLKSYARVLQSSALQQAHELDEAQRRGDRLGVLHGVPIAIKDLLFTRDVPTASGTRVMADFVPDYDATVVSRLREAGAVIIGKTQLTEGAFGAHHPSIEPPRNPWNAAYWPGVSSSGSGVAVAAGLAFGALGSDTGGSIRFPSASCGLVGLKPTYGRVSRHGAFALAHSLDHIGPMTRSVEDAARMLGAIAGVDVNDPTTLDVPVPNYLESSASPPRGGRIGVDWRYVREGVAAEVVATIEQACQQFETLGVQVVDVTMPAEYRNLVDGWGITCAVECARAHAEYYPAHKALYGPVLANLLDLGAATPASEYQALQILRDTFRAKLDRLFERVDVMILPNMIGPVPTVAQMDSVVSEDDSRAAFINFTAPSDYSGHPTLTVPVGLDANGLPRSFQLMGKSLGEKALIDFGLAYERASGAMPHPAD
ncbi:MAG: amidase [bacterium]